MPELLFHGAAGEVTGSMHMVKHNERWLALDCGLYQGKRSDSEENNRQWPMDPKLINALILSHAHIDHTGRVPKLVRDGYDGPIYCTPATRDLCAIMLADAAHIQEEDAEYLNKKLAKKGKPPIEPLYEYKDVLAAMHMMQTISYNRDFFVLPGVKARFNEAGHMLGSAGVTVKFDDQGTEKTLYFTGDVGRPDKPILRDPAQLPDCDAMICESTYGGRVTPAVAIAETEMLDVVRRTIKRGGRVIVPAFSVGRTQTIVYYLHQEMVAKNLPRIKIYVDSPLATNATDVFRMHPECYDAEARSFHQVTGDILGGRCCSYTRSVDESKALQASREPCVIISASGMCEAGRIRHHLKSAVGDPK
ncbi:MAG: MBL fold metallo-hydrolase, partial [Phycisphaerales bacterium]|nr:MBL fold metallo-hydrolase [Phycisphaerales bacterium]